MRPATNVTSSSVQRFDEALDRLLDYGPTYEGGLSNHGPMALEALASQGREDLFVPFVDHYAGQLEPGENRAVVEPDWQGTLAGRLPELVAVGASQAGHGLLRVAHATRSLERANTPTRRRELAAAIDYWASGRPLSAPSALSGSRPLDDVVRELPRLENAPDGLLTHPLTEALARDDVVAHLTSIEPADDPAARFDELALLAAEAMTSNRGLPAFGLLHGVTVSTMARHLLDHLDEEGVRALEAAVTAFVVAAVVGLDRSFETDPPELDRSADSGFDELLDRLVRRLGDHDIKFADAASGLYRRTGSPTVIDAVRARLVAEY